MKVRVVVIDCPIDFDIPLYKCMKCEFNGGFKKDNLHLIVDCSKVEDS